MPRTIVHYRISHNYKTDQSKRESVFQKISNSVGTNVSYSELYDWKKNRSNKAVFGTGKRNTIIEEIMNKSKHMPGPSDYAK